MAEQFILEIDWSNPDLPRRVGPFDSRAEADEWGELNIVNGEWNVAPLAQPYARAKGARLGVVGMTDYEQAYRDLRAGLDRLRKVPWHPPFASAREQGAADGWAQALKEIDALLASSASATASEHAWDPETPCPCGRPETCPATPATASEGTTECTCPSGFGGEFRFHRHPCGRAGEIDAATGVTSSDGDRGLSEDACEIYPSAGQTCVTAGPEVIAAEGLCGTCATRILAARTAQPEGTEHVEWGVRDKHTTYSPGGSWTEEDALYLASTIPGAALLRRTVTTYAPVVGPWEVVGDE